MSILKQVRELVETYETRVDRLTREYNEELNKLQSLCSHKNATPWQYIVDTRGRIATNEFGVLYKSRECLECGKVEKVLDDSLAYDSEIPF